MKSRRIVLAFAAIGFLLIGIAAPVSSTPYGWDPGAPQVLPDSTDHWFCFDSNVNAGERQRFRDAMQYLDSATAMYDVETGTCGSATDIIYRYSTPIPGFPGARGYDQCTVHTGYLGLLCDQNVVWVDYLQVLSESDGTHPFEINLHKTIRHETGHTAGLSHHDTAVDAMRSGPIPFDWGYFSYSTHDICHIQTFFGASC